MIRKMNRTAIILMAALVSLTSCAFQHTFGFIPKTSIPLHKTTLNLIPEQGSQLIAASVAMYMPHEEEEGYFHRIPVLKTAAQPDSSNPTITQNTQASRALLSRIFRGKSYQEPDLSEWNKFHSKNDLTEEDGDVVYYPIVGFRWCSIEVSEGTRYKVLPTVSAAACSLSHGKALKEKVVGWFSPACVLKCSYDDEDEES